MQPPPLPFGKPPHISSKSLSITEDPRWRVHYRPGIDVRYLDGYQVAEMSPFIAGFVVLTGLAGYQVFTIFAHNPTGALVLAVLFGFGFVQGLRKLYDRVLNCFVRISIRGNVLQLVSSKGIVIREHNLETYTRADFGVQGSPAVLRLLGTFGAVNAIGTSAASIPGRAAAQVLLAYELRAYFPQETIVVLGSDNDPNPVTKYFAANDYEPPEVAMLPGVRYRYMHPEHFRFFMGRPGMVEKAWADLHSVFGFIALASFLAIINSWLVAVIILLADLVAWAIYAIRYRAMPVAKLRESVDDTFELVPEGLRVTRRSHTWIVRDPQPSTGPDGELIFAFASIVRFGTGADAYYFDPRFIERDE